MRLVAILAAMAAAMPVFAQEKKGDPLVARGKYVVSIAGCNDCHTPNFPMKGGEVPESEWLTGDALGWRGPWGTTYASNLRIYMQGMSEEQWIKTAKTLKARPPMPWFNVRRMSTTDLRAIYRYVRHLGPAGKPAPAYVPPDKAPQQPYVQFPG